MPDQEGATPQTNPSDSAGKTYDEKYVNELKQESINNRLKAKEMAAKMADYDKVVLQLNKLKSALGDDVIDPDAKLNQVINDNKILKNALESERRERLILSRASKAAVTDVDLLTTLLRDKDVDELNVDQLIKAEIEKHPVLKAQSESVAIGVFPNDSNARFNLKSEDDQARFMNKMIRNAKGSFA